MSDPILTTDEALSLLNQLRNNIIGTQHASWSNAVYPLVAILNAAGYEMELPTDEQMADHGETYGGAGGYPGNFKGKRGRAVRRAEYVAHSKKGFLWKSANEGGDDE